MAGGWFTCQVKMAGPADDGKIYIGLQDTATPPNWPGWQWYYAIAAMQNQMLATALAAASTGYTVNVALVDTAQYSQVNRFYLVVP